MRRFLSVLLLVFSASTLFSLSANSLDLNRNFLVTIDGFRIDFSKIDDEKRAELLPGYVAQIETIKSANLPPEMLDLMREIPIIVDPKKPQEGSHALFTTNKNQRMGAVIADLRDLPSNRPILLHEMIHAWDWNKYSSSNPFILKSFNTAKSSDFFPNKTSHFMENNKEYFAISSTIYLTGSSEQPPFNCDILSKRQPEYVAFLEKLYGDHGFCH